MIVVVPSAIAAALILHDGRRFVGRTVPCFSVGIVVLSRVLSFHTFGWWGGVTLVPAFAAAR
jgi:hypothetical protein